MDLTVDYGRLERLCQHFSVHELSLFGSVLRPSDFDPQSDIDVLVEFQSGAAISLLDHVRLQTELTDLFGRNVDLVSKNGLTGQIREHILATRRVLYLAP